MSADIATIAVLGIGSALLALAIGLIILSFIRRDVFDSLLGLNKTPLKSPTKVKKR